MEDRDDSISDMPDGERVRPRRAQASEPEERPSAGADPEIFDADRQLPGAVLMVPNKHWGFEIVSSSDHPGACAHYSPGGGDAILVKGTDAEHIGNRRGYFLVDATLQNGLKKQTAFRLVPRPFRLRRLKLYFPERYLGRLEPSVLKALQEDLAREHPEE